MKTLPIIVAIATAALASSATAEMQIRFLEGAPKDRFVVINNGDCDLEGFDLEFDLTDTRGGLIFDTTAEGAGVEVFQPFQSQAAGVTLVSADTVFDGDKALTIRVAELPASQQLSFTIDVDDTLTESDLGQIRVTDSEMEDAQIVLSGIGPDKLTTRFDASSTALISTGLCRNG